MVTYQLPARDDASKRWDERELESESGAWGHAQLRADYFRPLGPTYNWGES